MTRVVASQRPTRTLLLCWSILRAGGFSLDDTARLADLCQTEADAVALVSSRSFRTVADLTEEVGVE